MAATQMNVRIDSELKAKGDAVFSALGLTSSEVVRAVWAYAANHDAVPAIVASALQASADDADTIETHHRVALAQNSHNLISTFRGAQQLSSANSAEALDYRAMREAAWDERLAERGLL